MSVIGGIGWAIGGRFGTRRRGVSGDYTDAFLLRDGLLERGIVPYPIKRFAKFDDACRMATLVAALSLHDCEIQCAPDRPLDVGVLGTNEQGCLQTNRKFYEDFVEHGRRRGRGSLFVYTLASMPVAEVSMHYKLRGPTAWVRSDEGSARLLLQRADAMLREQRAEGMLALDVSEAGGVGFVLQPAGEDASVVDLPTALDWVERYPTANQLVEELLVRV